MRDYVLELVEQKEGFNAKLNIMREYLQAYILRIMHNEGFFRANAFLGGTALRFLHNLPRSSEDLDFSLLKTLKDFDLSRYGGAVERELRSFGFDAKMTTREKKDESLVQSAFLKANTLKHLLTITTAEEIARPIPRGQVLKIKIEVDTDPPPGFVAENKFILQPIPFSVRTFVLPDLFAGKMHAVLCRRWKSRVKGRDWYDLVWYAANHPQLHLSHLEQRMIQSGRLKQDEQMNREKFFALTTEAVDKLDVNQARREVEPFVKNPEALEVWSREFFQDVVKRIVVDQASA